MRVQFELPSKLRIDWAECLTNLRYLRKALLHGCVCNAKGCSRYCPIGFPCVSFCCAACACCGKEKASLCKHSDACDLQQDVPAQDVKDVASVQLVKRPLITVDMVMQIEHQDVLPVSSLDVQALAKHMTAVSLKAHEASSVLTVGRFSQHCFGTDRFGCWLCPLTKPMARWCWHTHASAGLHQEQFRLAARAEEDLCHSTASNVV